MALVLAMSVHFWHNANGRLCPAGELLEYLFTSVRCRLMHHAAALLEQSDYQCMRLSRDGVFSRLLTILVSFW